MDLTGRFGRALSGSLFAASGALALAAPALAEPQAFRFHQAHVLGASLDMVVVASQRGSALNALQAARAEVDRLEPILSGWRADSELSRLNSAASAVVSAELFEVIDSAENWRRCTEGAFDGRMGRLHALWREGVALGLEVDSGPVRCLVAALGGVEVRLDRATRTVHRPEPAAFALDGVAKGYIVDRALGAARQAAPEVEGLMIDIGGDLRCWGRSPSESGWVVAVSDPAQSADDAPPCALLHLTNAAVATSGRGSRDIATPDGPQSHLLSPRTGRPDRRIASATTIARQAAEADALATALAVLEPEQGLALVDRLDGPAALIIDRDGVRHRSRNWPTAPAGAASPLLVRTAAAPAAGAWPAGFVARVDYQLPRFTGANVYSPYVVIWVTDEANRFVRALAMLGDDLDWIGQNYVWWRRFGRARPELIDAVARPTRPAGRYSATWDGRDQAGRPVAQGRYVVHVEVIREHGGHSYQAIPIELGSQPAQATAPADEEIGATEVRYGRQP